MISLEWLRCNLYNLEQPLCNCNTRRGVESSPMTISPRQMSSIFLTVPLYISTLVPLPKHLPVPGPPYKFTISVFFSIMVSLCLKCFPVVPGLFQDVLILCLGLSHVVGHVCGQQVISHLNHVVLVVDCTSVLIVPVPVDTVCNS